MLLEGFLALNPPQGFRAELVEGEIVVTPPPDGDHEKYISRIVRQVIKHSRTDMDFSENKGLRLRSGDACPENHVIPDVIFAPLASDLFGGAGPWMPLDGVAMVVEVTAGNLRKDRELKRRCYARGGVARTSCSTATPHRPPSSARPGRTTTGSTTHAPSAGPSPSPPPSHSNWRRRTCSDAARRRPPRPPGTMVDTADEPGGRPRGVPQGAPRGTSGLHRAGWWLTATRGDPRDSATESKPPGTQVPGKGETVV